MTRAIILAAGLSSRIESVTRGRPKCLLSVRGRSILSRQLDLLAQCAIEDRWVISGYRAELIREAVGRQANVREYPDFATTNNLRTLAYCADLLEDDSLILFSDVLLSRRTLEACVGSGFPVTLLVDRNQVREGTMRVRVDADRIADVGTHIDVDDGDGNFVGVAKISGAAVEPFIARLRACARDPGLVQSYYTETVRCLIRDGRRVNYADVVDGEWCEVDTAEDLAQAAQRDFYL